MNPNSIPPTQWTFIAVAAIIWLLLLMWISDLI